MVVFPKLSETESGCAYLILSDHFSDDEYLCCPARRLPLRGNVGSGDQHGRSENPGTKYAQNTRQLPPSPRVVREGGRGGAYWAWGPGQAPCWPHRRAPLLQRRRKAATIAERQTHHVPEVL
jgi:hypothetical protein